MASRSMPASSARRRVLSASRRVDAQRTADVAVVGEGAQRGLGHGVDDVGRDQLLDVEHVGVGGVLGAGAGPQRPLGWAPSVAQREPAIVGEALAVAGVGAMGVGDRDATAQGEPAGSSGSTLASMRETKKDATEAMRSRAGRRPTRRSSPAR